jgi:hypothetical protein
MTPFDFEVKKQTGYSNTVKGFNITVLKVLGFLYWSVHDNFVFVEFKFLYVQNASHLQNDKWLF